MALKSFATLVVASVFSLTMGSAQAAVTPLKEQQQGDITYITGGIGEVETSKLRENKSHYTLRVMNADKTGHFSGGTRLKISNINDVLLLDVTTGPIFYANLPEGHYLLESFNGEKAKQQKVIIKHGTPVDVRFSWKQD
jgi:hypothetical protein